MAEGLLLVRLLKLRLHLTFATVLGKIRKDFSRYYLVRVIWKQKTTELAHWKIETAFEYFGDDVVDPLAFRFVIFHRLETKFGRVMFLHQSVCPQEGGSASVHAAIPPPPEHTLHPGRRHPPGSRPLHPSRRLLLRMVRILLECILVYLNFVTQEDYVNLVFFGQSRDLRLDVTTFSIQNSMSSHTS